MDLDRLIAGDGLSVAFQPIVCLRTGEAFGVEALGRALAPEPIAPDVLLDRAHAEEKLLALDHAWRALAIEHVADARAADDLVVFLNIDTRIVDEPSFRPGFTRRRLDLAGLSPSRFVLELGERHASLGDERLRRLLPHYVAQGFRIAIDDLGVGHASLDALVSLRPSIVKLDRAIVAGAGTDSLRFHLLRALAEYGRRTGTPIVAEGIEDGGDLGAVLAAGIPYGQGFLLGHPLGSIDAALEQMSARWRGAA